MLTDAHLDLAFNALENGRNLFASLADLRAYEAQRPSVDGIATVTFPELRQGGVGLVFGTLFVAPDRGEPDTPKRMVYRTAAEAHRRALEQLDFYQRCADQSPSFRLVGDLAGLQEVLDSQIGDSPLLGMVPLMEGADPVREPAELEAWWARGLRLIGPAWDDTRYAAGAWRGSQDGFTREGFQLLEVMADLGFILDLTHLSEQAVFEALERYGGTVAATHSNCRSLVPHDGQRHLTDDQIRLIGERDGVIGVVLYNRFLKNNHRKGERKALVTLDHVAAHIDHICQLLGSADHVGLGSDFDGGFGAADIPAELDSAADLPKIGDKLAERGYAPAEVEKILGRNWVRLLQKTWGQ